MSLPPPFLKGSEKLLILASHLSVLFGFGILVPLIVYLAREDKASPVASHAREALNFHISVYIYSLCCIPLFFVVIGLPILAALGIATLILSIVASVRGVDGSEYRYPLTIRLVS